MGRISGSGTTVSSIEIDGKRSVMVSTGDCESFGRGSNPLAYPAFWCSSKARANGR